MWDRTRLETLLLAAGAVAGGLVPAFFRFQPAWLWGMGGGIVGGILGVAAAYLTRLSWPWPLRALAALLVFVGGLAAFWLILGRMFVLDPANIIISNP